MFEFSKFSLDCEIPQKSAEWPFIALVFLMQTLIPIFSDAYSSSGNIIMLVH